ncbi:MAG: xanthine dehydrogenase family protein molybdopterin-binding subunit [Dehalococcoidia bacterium]|nr:xanthine dehydrogenase family protein molybdopterin-binding subunit [Dehalococcoidia bacterium]
MTTTEKKYKVIGTRPIRHDGLDKVTGRARYGLDASLPGMLHAKFVRSPHAHARIKSIDVSRALALPGVKAIITGKDLPALPASGGLPGGEAFFNVHDIKENTLATKKALYKGHAIAVIAATSPHIAEEAAALVKVEYEVLPAVTTVQDAMKPNAPLLHDDLTTQEMGQKTDKHSNIASHFRFTKGDIDKGFKQADVIVEREFNTATIHQGYIEPHPALVDWDQNGHITVWTSTQGAFLVRTLVSVLLQVPESKVKVVPMEIGGGFGAKILPYLEVPLALLSKKSGHPVKAVMTRNEVFETTGPTSGSTMKVKMGATKDGRITAAKADLYFEAGAFPGSPVGAGAMCALACYNLENGMVDGYDVVCNKPKTGAYRAPGAPNAAFAVESVVDELCQKLKMDPLEFRLLNGVKEGDRRIEGVPFAKIGYTEVLQAVKNHPHWKAPIKGPNKGRGLAVGFWFNVGGEASAYMSVNEDGTVNLLEGSTDIGGSRASMAMQAAEVLGIPAEDVHPSVGDTDSIGITGVTGGSSATFKSGWAAHDAAQEVKKALVERAAKIWETAADNVLYEDGVFKMKPALERKMTFKELALKLASTGGPVGGKASVNYHTSGVTFAAAIADVEVDPETGKTQVLRFTIVQDAGKAIHPAYVEGQMQGGAVQGIGWALNEEYFMGPQGQMMNPTFLDYRMPTALDVPMIDTVIVEVPNPGHPYGVRGVGEVPLVPPIPAVANAINRATGVRMTVLPMSPGNVLKELLAKQKGNGKQ